jgi:hypothetical protein
MTRQGFVSPSSVGRQQRTVQVAQYRPAGAAQQEFTQARVAVATHDEQVGLPLVRERQQRGAHIAGRALLPDAGPDPMAGKESADVDPVQSGVAGRAFGGA